MARLQNLVPVLVQTMGTSRQKGLQGSSSHHLLLPTTLPLLGPGVKAWATMPTWLLFQFSVSSK